MFLFQNPILSTEVHWCDTVLLQVVNISEITKKTWMFIVLISAIACQPSTTSFETFDSDQWIMESRNCNHYRIQVIENMKTEFEKFIGMNETELIEILGKPEETHLYTRGQKFFNYQLICDEAKTANKTLRIRFSALDYVNEVLVLD